MKHDKYSVNRYLIKKEGKTYLYDVTNMGGFYAILEDFETGERQTGFHTHSESKAIDEAFSKFKK